MPTTITKFTDHEVATAYLEEFNREPRGSNTRTAERLGMSVANLSGRLSRMRRTGTYSLPSVRGRRSNSYCPHCGAAQWAQKPDRAIGNGAAGPASNVAAPSPVMLSDD